MFSYLIFILPALILAMWAQAKVSGTYKKYSKVSTRRGLTGAQVARELLDSNNLSDIPVQMVQGHLSDHYDPKRRVLRLSNGVYQSNSVAAVGIAAHEAGHALQHSGGYAPLHLRSLIFPMASIGTNAAFILFILGAVFAGALPALGNGLMLLAILLFGGYVAFSLVTLPVEFNASRRAMRALSGFGYLEGEELQGAKKVLNAAALTYIAAAAMAIMQLLWMISARR